MSAPSFRFDPVADVDRTKFLSKVLLPPRRLVELFGPPGEADGYKVSGLYSFVDDEDNVFTIYDWKATSLYDDRSDVIGSVMTIRSPQEFWECEVPMPLHLGGREGEGDFEAFKVWIVAQIAATS